MTIQHRYPSTFVSVLRDNRNQSIALQKCKYTADGMKHYKLLKPGPFPRFKMLAKRCDAEADLEVLHSVHSNSIFIRRLCAIVQNDNGSNRDNGHTGDNAKANPEECCALKRALSANFRCGYFIPVTWSPNSWIEESSGKRLEAPQII